MQIIKRLGVVNGSPAFAEMYSITSGALLRQQTFNSSKSHDELREILLGIKASSETYGTGHPEFWATDRPGQEAKLIESIWEERVKAIQTPRTQLPLLELPCEPILLQTATEIQQHLQATILEPVRRSPIASMVIGFDMEWDIPRKPEDRVQLIQIACRDESGPKIYLLRVSP